jgi:protein required for attachment to host cells
MTPHWILVANATQARLLQQEPGKAMILLHESDAGGHAHFARDIADCLEQGAREHAYAWVAVYASSDVLGELRQLFGEATRKLLAGTHAIDLTAFSVAEIESRMRQERSRAH